MTCCCTHETPVSLFSHNECDKKTIKHWELDLFFIIHFTYLGVRTHPTHPRPPAYGPETDGQTTLQCAVCSIVVRACACACVWLQWALHLHLLVSVGFILYDTQLIIARRRHGHTDHVLSAFTLLATHWPTYILLSSVHWRCWLGGRKGIRPVKHWMVGCWRGYMSGARCWLAYGPADATATHFLLLQ